MHRRGSPQRHQSPSLKKPCLTSKNFADLGLAHSKQSVKDLKHTDLPFTVYGLEADCSCAQSPNLGSSLLDHPLGSYTENLKKDSIDQLQVKVFEHLRDREDFAGFHHQVGDFFDGLHGSEALDQTHECSNATEHGPDDVQSSLKSEQNIVDFLNRSPSGQVQGSGTKETSGFSGMSLSGSDSVTGIGNNQGSSESDLWGRIEGSIADQYNTSPTESVDSCDVIGGLAAVAAAVVCVGSGATACGFAVGGAFAIDKMCTTTDEELERVRDEQRRAAQDHAGCPTDPDDESGIYTGPRTNPIDLSQGDLGQGNPEDGSFGPEFTVPWHSYESDRPTLLDITGQPSERDVSNQKSERRGFTIDPVINPIPDGV